MNAMRQYVKYVAVFLIYTSILLSFSVPLGENLRARLIGGKSIDVSGAQWSFWFAAGCVPNLDLGRLIYTDLVAYPSGKEIFINKNFPLMELLAAPLQIFFDSPLDYNLYLFTIMALNGLSCFLLIRYLSKNSLIAFIGGLIFAVNPYVFYQINGGRPELGAIFWISFFALSLFVIRDGGGPKHIIIGALLLLSVSFVYWFYAVFLVLFAVLFTVYYTIADRNLLLLKKVSALALLYGFFMMLLLFHMVVVEGAKPIGYEVVRPFPSYADITGGESASYFKNMLERNSLNVITVKFTVIAAALGILAFLNSKAFKRNLFCLIAAVFFYILSFGPYLGVSDHAISLPYIFFYCSVPFFSRLWWPVNLFVIPLLCVAVLASSFMAWLRTKFSAGIYTTACVVFIGAWLFPYYNWHYEIVKKPAHLNMRGLDYAPPARRQEVYAYLGKQKDCVVLEVPFNLFHFDFLDNQRIHRKKLVNCSGYAMKDYLWPKAHLEFLKSNLFLSQLDVLFNHDFSKGNFSASHDQKSLNAGLKELYNIGVEYIVMNPRYLANYRHKKEVFECLLRMLKEPYREFPDGVRLYNVAEMIDG